MSTLKFITPDGSLSERMRMYLAKAGFDIDKPDRRGVCGRSADGRIEFVERDRRMIPRLVALGYDAGITGLDLILNSRVEGLRTVANLCFAKRSDRPTRWVLAGRDNALDRNDPLRIGTELENLPQLVIPQSPPILFDYKVVKLEGNEEMAIDDGLCDLILVVTETGKTLQDIGLTILPSCDKLLVSMPQIIAKPVLPPDKEEALQEVRFALEAVISAASRVMVKADLPKAALDGLQLPSEVSPTVASLAREGWIAVEVCIPRSDIGSVGLKLERAGGRAIVVQDVLAFSAGKSESIGSPKRKKETPAPYSGIPLTDTRGYHH